jgi:protein-disulfide isomerase
VRVLHRQEPAKEKPHTVRANHGRNRPEGMTREQGDAILEELRQIHRLLQIDSETSEPANAQAKLRLDAALSSFSLGKEDAPLTLVEFMDYQCPFCQRFQQEAFSELKREFIDTGKVRFVSLDLPLVNHPNAMAAAEAARCAGDQGRFWQMREELLLHPEELDPEGLRRHAESNGLRMDEFRNCIETRKYKSIVQKQIAQASSLSVSGTPSFLLAKTAEELMGSIIIGAKPYGFFETSIKELLQPTISGTSPDFPISNGLGPH